MQNASLNCCLEHKVNLSFIGEIVFVTNIILARKFVMLKYDGMNTMTKITNLNLLSISKKTQPISLHGSSSARPLRTFERRVSEAYFIKTICPNTLTDHRQ